MDKKNSLITKKNNVYIGNRYVPIFANPVEWDNLREYEPLTIVTYQGTSYTSKKRVPVGTELSDTEYWVVTGNYNAQVEAYRQQVVALDESVEQVSENVEQIETDLNGLSTKVDTIFGKTVRIFNTVAEMVADTEIHANDVVETKEYSVGKGGGCKYLVTAVSDNFSIALSNNLHAHVIGSVVTPSMFGANCDGTDDLTSLVKAINYAKSVKGKVLLDKNISIDGTISLTNFVSIEGINKGIKLIELGAHNIIEHDTDDSLFYVSLRNFTISGSNLATNGIYLSGGTQNNGCDTCVFDNLVIENINGIGVNLRNTLLTPHFTNIIIEHCASIGMNIASHDGFFDNIQVMDCTSNFGGVNLSGSANKLSNFKVYFIYNGPTAATGVNVTGNDNGLSNIDIQDLAGTGLKVQANNNSITNALISKISAHSGGDHTGIKLEGTANMVHGVVIGQGTGMLAINATGGYNNIMLNTTGVATQYSGAATNFHVINGSTT